MKNNKDLLNDLFNFFKEKYGKGEVFETKDINKRKAKVIKLNLAKETNRVWPDPALVLIKIGKEFELHFTEIVPDEGYDADFPSPSLEIHTTFNKNCTLWVEFGDSIADVDKLLVFNEGEFEKEMIQFQMELLSKLTDLAYSGKYKIWQ
jgi:hypothetical protein